MNNKASFNAKRLSLGGILLALTVITLFMLSIVPTNTLSFYALSSFFVSIIVVEFGAKSGWAFYASSFILALFLVPDKIAVIPYIVFFGIYGILKYYIEKLNNRTCEYFLKLLLFNSCLLISLLFIRQFFLDRINLNFPWWLIIILLEIVFLVYDYVYTLFVQYYNQKLKRLLKI